MSSQVDLLQQSNSKYVIDANALLDFWGSIPDIPRPYDVKVKQFKKLWDVIAKMIDDGIILVPFVIYKEVENTMQQEFWDWLNARRSHFVNHEECKVELAKIVNEYEIYTIPKKSSLQDAIVVAVAVRHGLKVITSEKRDHPPVVTKPKIPDVCDRIGVKPLSLPEFFKEIGM
jgi:hypothetical protein